LIAAYSVTREQRTVGWDVLVVSGIDERRIVWGKWWAIVRELWPHYLLLALPRIGIAYATMDYLNFYPSWIDSSITPLTRPFYYMSFENSSYGTPIAYDAAWSQVIIAVGVLLVIGLAELTLVAAIGLWAAFSVQRSQPLRPIIGGIARFALIPVAVGAVMMTDHVGWWFYAPIWKTFGPVGMRDEFVGMVYYGVPDRWCLQPPTTEWMETCHWARWEQGRRRVFETVQTAFFALGDGGILLAANILRPIASAGFVVRNIFSAILGLGLYAPLTWGFLRLAQAMAVRNHQVLSVE
jgi:hypothetical protein